MTPHNTSQEELLKELRTSAAGLSSQEARQRLERYGENKLAEKRKKTNLQRFLDQFKDVMILILLLAAAVSFVVACFGHDPMEFFEPVLILLIVVLNALLGMMQESKAEKAMDALKNMSAPHARVLRDGKEQVIDAAQLVPGDIIRLEAGDFIPADARLLKSVSLKSEESALTGESVPSEKDAAAQVEEKAPLGDRSNMVFSGCSVTYGTATAVVTGTGMDTEMGKIAGLLEGEEEGQTPLQQKLAQLGKYLGFVALGACAVIFVVGLLNGIPVLEIFMTAVSLAVSAIPEGLPAIVTIVLAIGVQRMAKKNALIRRLPAVETLGGASVICSDKTGTLTQNRMTLVKLWVEGENSLETVSTENSPAGRELLRYGALCCDGSVLYKEDGTEQHIGDPTETSILVAAHKNGMEQADLNSQYPRLAELPFDSDRKLMTSVNQMDGKIVAIVKGAFDMMAARCVAGDLEAAKEKNEEMSRDALRVLAVGYKILDEVPENPTSEELESGLTLMGLVGMIDPPRPEAKAAVATCRQAGIKPVMITGDHVVTASAIAKELGILEEGDKAITGAQLDAMSEEQLDQEVENISVYARVSPENKIRIVKAWQRKDQVVSMTGDGVNDAPAVKTADIGVAMGITGTEVTKESAKMILADDNFSTIVAAVREGRGIFDNIRKFLRYLLSSNVGEVFTVFGGVMLAGVLGITQPESTGVTLPLLATQLLWINLLTDAAPALAMGVDPQTEDVMNRKPRKLTDHVIDRDMWIDIAFIGIIMAVVTLIGMDMHLAGGLFTDRSVDALGHEAQLTEARTMGFTILVFAQLFNAIASRSSRQSAFVGLFSNKWLWGAIGLSVVLQLLVIYVPFLNGPFGTTPLSPLAWVECICLAAFVLIASEIYKAIMRAIDKARGKELSH